MKLKAIVFAALLASSVGAIAAPTLQTCDPMEVLHNSKTGLSYSLACSAGDWKLSFTGSVPAGTDAVEASYRLAISGPDGANFVQRRKVNLPAPSLVGRTLAREAVLLDNGDLALRDCPDAGCTLYRPLGSVGNPAKASVTVTPEVKRLTAERAAVAEQLSQRTVELASASAQVVDLSKKLETLYAFIEQREEHLTRVALKHARETASLQEQHSADIQGLSAASAKDIAAAREAAAAEVIKATSARDLALKDLATSQAATQKAMAEVAQARQEILQLQAALEGAQVAKAIAVAEVAQAQAKVAKAHEDMKAAGVNDAQAAQLVEGISLLMNQRDQAVAKGQESQLAAAELANKLASANADIAALRAEVSALQLQGAKDAALLSEVKAGGVQSATLVMELEQKLREAHNVIEKARGEFQQVETAVGQIVDENEALAASRDQALDRAKRAEDYSFELAAKLEAVVMTRDLAMQTVSVQGEELDSFKAKLRDLEEKVSLSKASSDGSSSAKIKELSEKLKEATEKIADYEDEFEELVDEIRKLRTIKTQADAYQFIAGDLVEKHNKQLAQLKKEFPSLDFSLVVQDLSVPTVTTIEGNGAPAPRPDVQK